MTEVRLDDGTVLRVGGTMPMRVNNKLRRLTILAVLWCAWCDRPFPVTTRTPSKYRATRRFCTKRCANLAGGMTHDAAWAAKMRQASIVARRTLARERALERMHGAKTPAQIALAISAIYRKAYMTGWQAGKKHALRNARRKFAARRAAEAA